MRRIALLSAALLAACGQQVPTTPGGVAAPAAMAAPAAEPPGGRTRGRTANPAPGRYLGDAVRVRGDAAECPQRFAVEGRTDGSSRFALLGDFARAASTSSRIDLAYEVGRVVIDLHGLYGARCDYHAELLRQGE